LVADWVEVWAQMLDDVGLHQIWWQNKKKHNRLEYYASIMLVDVSNCEAEFHENRLILTNRAVSGSW